MYTNLSNISLPLAVWLAANDGYDLNSEPYVISATTLLNPIRSIVLSNRIKEEHKEAMDIADLVPARVGHAVHTSVEYSWTKNYKVAMRNLGIPEKIINQFKINPKYPSNNPEFDLYFEKRSKATMGKWEVSGKFDIVHNQRVKDIKTTKTFNWIKGGNDEKYAQQGSIYRYLNQDIIKDDYMDVEMVFTDWNPIKAQVDKDYPSHRVMTRTLPLMSLQTTEDFIYNKLTLIEEYENSPQKDIPLCTAKELWMDPPKWAYYKVATKTNRATKLFDSETEAYNRLTSDGGAGSVVKRESEPTFCRYCKASSICLQANEYINQGILKL